MSLKIFVYENASISFNDGENLMVSATQMAKAFDKKPNDWLRLPSTQDFIAQLSDARKSRFEEMVVTERGGITGGGTWFHEDVAIEFARWLSPKFAIWCNDRIKELLKIGVTAINPEDLLTPENMIRAMEALKAARSQAAFERTEKELAQKTIAEQAPIVTYAQTVLQSTDLLTTNVIAADLGMSAVKLNSILKEKKVVYKQSGVYMLHSNYRNMGLADYKTHTYQDKEGKMHTIQHLYWTQTGRKFIIEHIAA